jgi:3-phenylpropionate/cinnamic acid dioxygenase small subunit
MTTPKDVTPEVDLAVRRLLARYCHLVDDHDYDAAAALFTDDGRFRLVDDDLKGQAAIRSWMDSIPPSMSHQVSNVVVSNASRSDTYHAVSDLTASIKTNGAWSVVFVGRYHDTLSGDGRDMKFTQRIVTGR